MTEMDEGSQSLQPIESVERTASENFYSQPSGVPDQGSLLRSDAFADFYPGSAAIVLTPRCDLVGEDLEYVLLGAVVGLDVLARKKGWLTKQKLGERIPEIVNRTAYRWHYLPPTEGFPFGAAVDFQLVLSADVTVLPELDAISNVREVYREQIAQRYASYTGRVGTEDLVPVYARREFRNRLIDGLLEGLSEDRA